MKKILLFTVVGSAFAFVCLMVFLSGGKSAFWISNKIKIGAFLLSLSSFTASGCFPITCYDAAIEEPTCYEVAVVSNSFVFDNYSDSCITIDYKTPICGRVDSTSYNKYIFEISNDNSVVKQGVIAIDSSFFKITETEVLDRGKYHFKVMADDSIKVFIFGSELIIK